MVLPQYVDEQMAAEQAAQAAQAAQADVADLANQAGAASPVSTDQLGQALGAPLDNRIGANAIPTDVSSFVPTNMMNQDNLPVDALGDADLVNRIQTWPTDKQPFWYLNRQAIEQHRGDSSNPAQPAPTQPNPTSFFAG